MPKIKVNRLDVSYNQLEDFEGIPSEIELEILYADNLYQLKTLFGLPKRIGGSMILSHSGIRHLIGCPEFVGGSFILNYSSVENLTHGPSYVEGDFQAAPLYNQGQPMRIQDVLKKTKVNGNFIILSTGTYENVGDGKWEDDSGRIYEK